MTIPSGLEDKQPDILQPGQSEVPGTSGLEAAATDTGKPNTQNKNQMQPQQFNAWLNLFSELDPIAQSKSGNVA